MSETHLEDLTARVKPRTATTILLWGLVAFVVIFVVWAALTELERTVRGMGRVVPSSQLQVVSNPEGGVVEEILVRPGDMVRAGQELVRLDPTQSGAELGSGRAASSALDVKIARLEAEVQGRSPVYPAASNMGAVEQIRIEQALHASRSADLASTLAAGQARLSQAERSVAEAEAAYEARRAAAEASADEADLLRPLVQRGIEPRLSLIQAESAAAIARSEAAAASASIARSHAAVAEARASLAQLRQMWRSQAASELATAQAELASRRPSLPALAERLDRTVVRTPVAGRVNRVLVTTRGGSVQAGQPLAEIVPSDDALLVEARIRPQDIAFVRLGQDARVGITAYDPAVYGRLDGEVTAISPDAVLDEQSNETFYVVLIRTMGGDLRGRTGAELPIGPGMVADVSLIGDTRTILEYILTPLTRLRDTAFQE